jgi:ribosome-binding protein aMBF1 (putative translation factor)
MCASGRTTSSSKRHRNSTLSAIRAGYRARTRSDQERLAAVIRECEQLVRIAASVLRGARQDCDVKQATIAQLMARGPDAISNMESGRTEVTIADFVLWARVLGISPEELFDQLTYRVRKMYRRTVPFGS